METDKKPRITQEKRTVEIMIRLYCRKKRRMQPFVRSAKSCSATHMPVLTIVRSERKKSSCKKCPVHCYKPAMRKRMREVMRFSGPRMLFYAPLEAIRHLFS
ncbi:nitrous oxide-stimulated promoter family protein [Bacteroides thetaiotaomicron]|nr:nitrous oxide-stimulated promoter family protein [Bacteroides thetaiotaomicron]